MCDIKNSTDIQLTLPSVANVDRRIYHVKVIDSSGSGAVGAFSLKPNALDGVEGSDTSDGRMGSDGTARSTGFPLGRNMMLLASNDDGGWWIL